MRTLLTATVLVFLGLTSSVFSLITDEDEAETFMKEIDHRYSHECNQEMTARWEYIVDVANPDKETAANAAAVKYMSFKGEAALNSSLFAYEDFSDVELYRRFRFLSKQGPGALDTEQLTRYKELQAGMETTYSTATICDFHEEDKCDLTLEPDIEEIMFASTDYEELTHVWESWREVTGKIMRDDYTEFVQLSNKAAQLDGFTDAGLYWLNGYTVTDREATEFSTTALTQEQFRSQLDQVWEKVSNALYKKLHAYVRTKLAEIYPGKIDLQAPIPAHILGNMWAQDWSGVARHVMPFPEMPSFDVTDSMKEKDWDIQQMFVAAEDFFTSIGLFPMTDIFWEKSVINQTEWGKTMLCHASAEDFCLGPDGDDYRIKMCTDVDMVDLITVHHEMGHIEYFMAYKNQPHVFRDSANAGFHEAIGDLIALSVSTPKHLKDVLDLDAGYKTKATKNERYTDDEKRDLNFLMKMALEKIAFLPFGFLIDKYRWSLFDGSTTSDNMNAAWWQLREDLQGVSPPNDNRGEDNFDAGAKYHVPANVPYIRYFVSFIVQFQFHKQLCQVAGHEGPLHTCDIYNNEDAGQVLKNALEAGFSEPWPVVLANLGGSPDMDPQAIIEYFQPLIDYLDEHLIDQCIGWGDDCATLDLKENKQKDDSQKIETTEEPPNMDEKTTISPTEEQAMQDMENMDRNMTLMTHEMTLIDWEYNTNVTDETSAASAEFAAEWSEMYKSWWEKTIKEYEGDYETFKDQDLKRQFEIQKNIGTSILSKEDNEKLNTLVNTMTNAFSEGVVCPEDNRDCNKDSGEGYNSDDLESIMANETDPNVLQYYWKEWRDITGQKIKEDYVKYTNLQNDAATQNDFKDAGIMWLDPYTSTDYTDEDFKKEIESLWEEVKPLYQNLHAYVRYRLKENEDYKALMPDDNDPIPAHILGNMWAQSWENIYDLVAPYPDVPLLDISETLEEKATAEWMFKKAEEFFVGIDLYGMTDDFKQNSLKTEPNHTVVCHASAWDFYDTENPRTEGEFRIKMCTDKNQEDFIVIHHEMGHIEYQMAYSVREDESRMPMVFRDGANPGFHEAIGDTIALSVSTPKHLQMIEDDLNGVSTSLRADAEKQDINFLMKQALAKVSFLPFAYILDKWRWDAFSKEVDVNEYNRRWWELRAEYQGIAPPVKRDPKTDFDIGCKFHVPQSVPYIRYFVAHILQFQFHKELANTAGCTDDIYNCDIDKIKEAGRHLKSMLMRGASQPWQTQLDDFLVDGGGMNASAILEYFQPLSKFLENEIEKQTIVTGWKETEDILDKWGMGSVTIPPTVPIIVGAVLAAMIVVVIVAYFVGVSKQNKKAKKGKDNSIEMT
ncbi:unnamed protein product [Meganyctiphanes norvegica]|uniref:Angiotensin-converting enzyme n=1 Tax=Meganyctiphanes norvegica TaxID=48144 RepID=A0AAV2PHY0_MEGNR